MSVMSFPLACSFGAHFFRAKSIRGSNRLPPPSALSPLANFLRHYDSAGLQGHRRRSAAWRFLARSGSSARRSCWPEIYPGETQTLSLAIYNFVQLGKDPEAYALLGITVALAFLFVWCSEWLLRTRSKRLTCCCVAGYRWRILSSIST